MVALLEGVAVIQLHAPALLSIGALNVVNALRLAIAPCVNFRESTAEAKLRFQFVRQGRPIDDVSGFVYRRIICLDIILPGTVELALSTKAEFRAA